MHYMNFMKPVDSPSATKTFSMNGTGKWKLTAAYKGGKLFDGYTVPVGDIFSLHDSLSTIVDFPAFLIVGAFKDGVDLKGMVRRKRDNSDGLEPTIEDRELPFLPIDIDGWMMPENLTPEQAIKFFIRQELPEEFHNTTFTYQLSASFGLKDEGQLKAHLFFWMEEPVHNLRLRTWAKQFNKDKDWGNIVDPSIYTCSQPIYTQRRICIGASDPIDDPVGMVKGDADILCWNPDLYFSDSNRPTGQGNKERKEEKTSASMGFDISDATKGIVSGENFHENVRGLALSMMNAGVAVKKIKAHIEGLMKASVVQDDRWKERFDDINRLIETAKDIVNIPTFDDIIKWLEEEDVETIKFGFAKRVAHLGPVELETVKSIIQEKTELQTRTINNAIKAVQEEVNEQKAEFARNKKSEERAAIGLVEIDSDECGDNEIGDITAEQLAKSRKSPEIFMSNDGLACIVTDVPKTVRQLTKLDEQGKDYPKMPIIRSYGVDYDSLRRRVNKEVVIVNNKGKEMIYPRHILTTIAGISNIDWNKLSGIVENPFVDDNWNVVQKSGYNKRTGLYAVLHHKLKLTKMEPKDAYRYLAYEVFDEFPFASEMDRAAAVGCLITAIQRPSVAGADGFPGFAVVSPTQSSGKTTLAQLISHAAFNRPIAATGWSEDDEEMGKHLISVLMEGHSCVLFDNIPAGAEIKSNELAKAMTSDSYSRRKLGSNETINAAAAVLWIFTGNNIQLVGDFNTRVLSIKIMPKTADPDKRVFKRPDIGQWALDNRKKILSAAISIIMSGKDIKPTNTGSRFKAWDKFVRLPLLEVSGYDLLEVFSSNKNTDPYSMAKTNLLYQIFEEFKGKGATAKEIMVAAGGGDAGTFNTSGSELKDAIVDLFGERANNPRSIGRYLAGMDGQIFGGYQLVSDKSKPIIQWVVARQEDE